MILFPRLQSESKKPVRASASLKLKKKNMLMGVSWYEIKKDLSKDWFFMWSLFFLFHREGSHTFSSFGKALFSMNAESAFTLLF